MMVSRVYKRLLHLAAALSLAAALGSAQEFRATVMGRIFDSSGGAIPNAKIQIVNVANSETSAAVADSTGTYSIPLLRPGNYRLTVTADGFKQFIRENIILEVGRVVGIDVTMELGAVTENITVTAEAAILETQTASRYAVVNNEQVLSLPLNARNPFMLGAMMSGVTFRGAAIWQRPFDNGAIAEWSVNGGRQMNNEFLLDGAPNNAQLGGNNIAYVPIVDAVQEFSIQQNSYDSQYGKTGGGVFNVVLKSGTQDTRVTAWQFMRRRSWDANTFQNNAVGVPRPDHTLDQYGVQIDGQVKIPKLLKKDGRTKMFYLGSIENYYEKWPQFLRNSFPSMEMRQGDFSRLHDPQGRPVTIYDPMNFTLDARGDPVRAPFAGNRIPGGRIHPVARNLTRYMPEPNATTPGVRYSQQNLLHPEYAATDNFYNVILKFDWNFGDKHRTFFRYAGNDRTEDRCVNGICAGPGMDGQQPFQRINHAMVQDWVTTLNPTTVFNARFSYNRFVEQGFGRGNVGYDLIGGLGLPASVVNQVPEPRFFGRWEFGGNYSPLGRYQGVNITNTYALMSNVTKIIGQHTLKFGIDIRRTDFIVQNTGNMLMFNTDARYTQRLFNQGEPIAGDAYASFLLGYSHAGQVHIPLFPFNQNWYIAPFIQNDWRVSRRLTLNLGLRLDLNMAPTELHNRMNRGFNPNAAAPFANEIPADMRAMYPQLQNLRGGLEFAGTGGNPAGVHRQDFNNFQPRVGFAYQVSTKLVLRGGYGLYFLNPNNNFQQFAGFSETTPLVATLDDHRTPINPAGIFSNPYPDGILQPQGAGLGYNTFVGRNQTWFNPNFVVPYIHQFSFGVQYQTSRNSTLDVSYVGSRTVGANDERNFNIPSAQFRASCNLLEGGDPVFCNQVVTNPFRGISAFRGTVPFTAAQVTRFQMNRPFPQFFGNMLEQGMNTSNIWYNSVQINYNQRITGDLVLLANYTGSKMIERWGFNDPFVNAAQQGLYFSDMPHVLKLSGVYWLPFGKGKAFGSGVRGLADKFISGWQLNGFWNFRSGEPNNLPGNVVQLRDPRTQIGWDGNLDWTAHQVRGWSPCVVRQFNDGRLVPTPTALGAGCGNDISQYVWLQTADFAPRMTPFRSGQIRKQYFNNVDMSLLKTTMIGERARVEFGIEAFNAFNRNFFGRDSHFITNPEDPNFGSLFPSQAWIGNGYPRQVQLRLKFYW
jgi:hypothetical protein